MTIQLGLFDVFTYTIPGSLYLALIAFVGERLHWLDIGDFRSVPSIVLVGGLLICSYLLGFAANPVAEQLDRWLTWWKAVYAMEDIREAFTEQVPTAGNRPYCSADKYLLQALAEATQSGVALEISRFRATGLMLRNCAPPFLLACVVSITEAATGGRPVVGVLCALLFGGAVLSCIGQGKRLRDWAESKTLQICFWIPNIDEMVTHAGPGMSSRTVPRAKTTGGDETDGRAD